jgi:hypothetical protein
MIRLLTIDFDVIKARQNGQSAVVGRVLPEGTNFFWLPSPPRINLEEPISSSYPACLGLTWRNQFLLVTQPV